MSDRTLMSAPPPTVTIASTPTASTTGTATVTASGGSAFTYAWKQDGNAIAATTAALTGLVRGTYTCTVTSGSASASVTTVVASTAATALQFQKITPTYLTLKWTAVSNASAYSISYSTTSSSAGFVIYATGLSSTTLNYTLTGLTPNTMYWLIVQTKVGSIAYTTSFSGAITLPPNAATSYSKASIPILANTAAYNINSIAATSSSVTRDSIVSSVLKTGDVVSISGTKTGAATPPHKSAQILNPTESLSVYKNCSVYIPVTTTGTVSNLVLTSKAVQPITVNTNSVVVNGSTYAVGSSFPLDGQQVTVWSA